MWKNFLQQWRHPVQTVVELLLPVATLTMVLILRWQIEPSVISTRIYPPIEATSLTYSAAILDAMDLSELSIAYSPRSPVLEEVVREAMLNLIMENDLVTDGINLPDGIDLENLDPSSIADIVRPLLRIDGYTNSEDLKGIYADEKATRLVIAAIEFDNQLLDATQLSTNLSYSLRFPERLRMNSFYQTGGRDWRTENVFPVFEVAGPRFPFALEGGNDPGYVNEMFIALQQVISTELIVKATGDEELRSFKVHIQRFPHPSYVQDMGVEVLQYIFPMFIVLSFSYTAINITRAVTVEKEMQLKGTMKLMGLPTWLHWMAWFCKQFLFLSIAAILLTFLLKVHWFSNEEGFTDYAVFTNTPWTVLLFFTILYLTCTIFFCFMISGFFNKGSTAALFTGVIWFLSYVPAFLLTMDIDMSYAAQIFTCLSINSAMSYGFQLMLAKESTGGLQWGDFMSSPEADTTRFSFGNVIVMLVVDCVLYMLIALYLEQVFPGPIGTPKRWYFPFQYRFWCPNKNTDFGPTITNGDIYENIINEKEPRGHTVGVEIRNLTKIYGNHTAVNNLSMNIFDDQITVLLGHNGAGKSTTISMLTGNLEVTHGSISVAGYDMSTQTNIARSHIGLCSQHNVLFNELTVREHLEFFAKLKGSEGEELRTEIDSLIEKLELQEKCDYPSKGLSGGQKRRLCVGIALSGQARVVLLDEPTSGMDPASRRGLWELLQREKKGRSMILTTHFMDEADVLGDRVAIMADGRLQCMGSPYFLKRHYGVGYTLVVVKQDDFDHEQCTAIINKYIPGITIKEDRGFEVTYSLTNDYSSIYEDMLNELEENVDKIKFANYGLLPTTLEDVFMSVGADLPVNTDTHDVNITVDDQNEIDTSLEELDKEESSVTGIHLIGQHILAVWMKLWLVQTRSLWTIGMQFIAPIAIILSTLGVMEYILSFVSSIVVRPLSLAQGFTITETLLSYIGTNPSALGALASTAYSNIFQNSDEATIQLTNINAQSIEEYYLSRTADPVQMGVLRPTYRILIGSTFDDNSATAWFSNFGYHDVAISLATLHSALLKARNEDAVMNVYNHPLEATYADQSDSQAMVALVAMQLASGIGSSLAIVSAVFVMFYIKERVSGAQLLQKAAGVTPVVLWGAAAVFDWLWFLLTCLPILLCCVIFSVNGLSTFTELGRMYLAFMVYGAAMLPFTYLMSNFFKGHALGFVILFFANSLFGNMGPTVVDALSASANTQSVANFMDAILQLFPLYSLVTAVRSLNQIGLVYHTCLESCSLLVSIDPNFECTMETLCERTPSCCVPDNPHFMWEEPGILRYLVLMIIAGVVFWLILMALEYRLIQKVFRLKQAAPPVSGSALDADVSREAARAHRAASVQHALLADGLTKYYGKHLAVDQVSFSVSDGECFGLLGVNGAGKTTTFKMLMGDESISCGDAYVSGHSVQTDLNKVHQNIGYCPQFDALFLEMTGRETLRMFARMRGLRVRASEPTAVALASALGFLKHLDKRAETYSGGTKRKLNTGVAFLGRTRLVFMDEPTTGVDPAAKRHVQSATRAVRRAGRGVLLTSHSMEECEALCDRLTIMVNGRFQCLGTPQHLKNKFSQGFTLTIKMKKEELEINGRRTSSLSTVSTTDAIKQFVNNSFKDPKIMEEYQGLLTYYLPDRTIAWSRMFGIMERAKHNLHIEDYSISQTSLEQVFLQFTKYQREERL